MPLPLNSVTIYYNTGLSPGNSMDSPTKFFNAGFQSLVVTGIVTFQARNLVEVKIETTADKMLGADYCVITNTTEGNMLYWITDYEMLNPVTVKLKLQLDYFTTVGLENITIVNGWATRSHLSKNRVFKNTIPEPFQPMESFKLDFGGKVAPTGLAPGNKIGLVVSTVDLREAGTAETTGDGKVYKSPNEGVDLSIIVPILPPSTKRTLYSIGISGGLTYPYQLPSAGVYRVDNPYISSGLNIVRSLGIDSAIIDSYSLPNEYVEGLIEDGDSGFVEQLIGVKQTVDSAINPTWGLPGITNPEPKVYSGQFQKYVLMSVASGEKLQFDVEDILTNTNKVQWEIFADLLPEGRPSCRPLYYHGEQNEFAWIGNVNGLRWQKNPLMYVQKSGESIDSMNFIGRSISNLVNLPNQLIKESASGGFTPIAFATSAFNKAADALGNVNEFRQNTYNVAPEIAFSPIQGIQNYIGNYFYELRYRLSDRDMKRFNDFLMMNGEAVSQKLTIDLFTNRQSVNFIQADQVQVKLTNGNPAMKQGIEELLRQGLRIWHILPRNINDNPDAG